MSSYEDVIIHLLKKNKVEFTREVQVADLRNGKYRFDFYLPFFDAYIEVQGEQHYKYIPRFYKNRSDFLKAQERDRQKIAYCRAHQKKLYCIPYWEVNTIQSMNDLFDIHHLATTIYHNDLIWAEYQKNK